MLKKLFVSQLLISAVTAHAITVISDLDDTLKITQVRSKKAAVYNGVLGSQAFTGMPELMQGFKASDEKAKIIFVSGSPNLVRYNVNRLIQEQNIPADEIQLLGNSKRKGAFLLKLAEETQDDLILMGDDQEMDPQFYEAVQKAYPDRVKAIYIHKVNNKPLPQGQVGFFTAYEIALNEMKAGRLGVEQIQNVKSKIERDLNLNPADPFITRRVSKGLIPTWHKCSKVNPFEEALQISMDAGLFEDETFFEKLNRIYRENCQK